jgi:hypothetical protein
MFEIAGGIILAVVFFCMLPFIIELLAVCFPWLIFAAVGAFALAVCNNDNQRAVVACVITFVFFLMVRKASTEPSHGSNRITIAQAPNANKNPWKGPNISPIQSAGVVHWLGDLLIKLQPAFTEQQTIRKAARLLIRADEAKEIIKLKEKQQSERLRESIEYDQKKFTSSIQKLEKKYQKQKVFSFVYKLDAVSNSEAKAPEELEKQVVIQDLNNFVLFTLCMTPLSRTFAGSKGTPSCSEYYFKRWNDTKSKNYWLFGDFILDVEAILKGTSKNVP